MNPDAKMIVALCLGALVFGVGAFFSTSLFLSAEPVPVQQPRRDPGELESPVDAEDEMLEGEFDPMLEGNSGAAMAREGINKHYDSETKKTVETPMPESIEGEYTVDVDGKRRRVRVTKDDVPPR